MDMFFWENEKNQWSHFLSRSSDGTKGEFCPVFWPWVSQIFGFGNFYGMSIVNTSCTTYVPNLVVLAKLQVPLSTEDAKTWYPHSGHFGMRETEKNLKARGLKIINHVDVAGFWFVMGSRTYIYAFHTFVVRWLIFGPWKNWNFLVFWTKCHVFSPFVKDFLWTKRWMTKLVPPKIVSHAASYDRLNIMPLRYAQKITKIPKWFGNGEKSCFVHGGLGKCLGRA